MVTIIDEYKVGLALAFESIVIHDDYNSLHSVYSTPLKTSNAYTVLHVPGGRTDRSLEWTLQSVTTESESSFQNASSASHPKPMLVLASFFVSSTACGFG